MTFVDALPRNGGAKADLIVQTLLLFFGYVTLGLRLWSRRLKGIGLQLNDWLIIAATFFLTARYGGELCVIFVGGLGLHVEEVITIGGPEALTKFLKILYAIDLLWITIMTLIKLSILCFYVQVFYIEKRFVYSCYFAMTLSMLWGIACLFHFAFFCTPVEKSWRPTLSGHCGNDNVKYIMWGSFDIVIDAIIIALPMPVLYSLQMPMAKKIGLIGVFGLGFGILTITGVRFKFYKELDLTDATYSLSSMALFAALAPLLGIINANIPVIPPALQFIFKSNIFSTQAGSSGGTRRKSQLWSSKSSKTGGGSRFEENDFERLSDHDIPLVDVQGGRKDESAHDKNNHIQVTTDWRVQSTPNQV